VYLRFGIGQIKSVMASIGQVTGTLVHSGPKHILQSRVAEDVLKYLGGRDNEDKIYTQKNLFCVHKHELTLCCNKPLNEGSSALYRTTKQAYPVVLSTLGLIETPTKNKLRLLYSAQSVNRWNAIKQALINFQIPDFSFQGVALTQAWATTNFGDNIGSVLVAGYATVMNGHFPLYAGDAVQWYFDFEYTMFNLDGSRRTDAGFAAIVGNMNDVIQHFDDPTVHPRVAGVDYNQSFQTSIVSLDEKANTRHDRFDMKAFGKYPEMKRYKENVVYPKVCHHYGNQSSYGDRRRVFGKVINGARPFEPVDILILSQCR